MAGFIEILRRVVTTTLLLSTLLCPCAAQQSTVAELDLVFPRNETYKPVYPFPVIFAIQNPAVIWPYYFTLVISLSPIPQNQTEGLSEQWPWLDEGGFTETQGPYTGGEDPVIKTYLDTTVVNTTVKDWIVGWRVYLTYNCTPSETEGEAPLYANRSEGGVRSGGLLRFTIDEETGKLPQIYEGEDENAACPRSLWTVDIIGEASNGYFDAPTRDPSMCPYFNPDNPHPDGNPCAVKPSEELAQNVNDLILSHAQCVGWTSWPNTSYTHACFDEEWEESGSPRPRGLLSGTLALGCIIMTVGYFWIGWILI